MKIGLALSGGGARGIAHLGVLKALEEKKIKPSIISGTSAGALTGALYAYGYSPDELFDIIAKTRIITAMRPSLSVKGLLKPETLGDILKKYIEKDDFSSLKIPLV
ncbi:MAG: patatin-like phospholipase family protein, partial [Cyclobacteriaceae bacterium]|nr:patatin-like phospholipase family protein [Cyclobacteriaceae bacterium]